MAGRNLAGPQIGVRLIPGAAVAAGSPPGRDSRRSLPWWRLVLRIVAAVVVVAVAVSVLDNKLPSPTAFWAALQRARWGWVAAAFVLQVASIGMIVRQQRRILRALGVRISLPRVGLITYSSTAISMSLPAGGAVGAGYSYRQYRANGASAATAATVLLLSGLVSTAALVLLFLAGFGLAGISRLRELGDQRPETPLLIGAGFVAAIAAIGWLTHWAGRRANPGSDSGTAPTPRLDAWSERHPRLGVAVRGLLTTGRQAQELGRGDWRLVLVTSFLNWALDLACLYASCRAFGIMIPPMQLALIYLGIQLVRQIPITPGGIGVIEVSLLAALVASGSAQGPAAGAVLIYRLFAAWMLLPIGYVMLAILRLNKPAQPALQPTADSTT